MFLHIIVQEILVSWKVVTLLVTDLADFVVCLLLLDLVY